MAGFASMMARLIGSLHARTLALGPAWSAAMTQMMDAWIAQALYVVVKLGIPDELGAGPRSAQELAAAASAHAPTLERLLRTLASVGFLAVDGEGRFGLNRLSRPLTSSAPDSIRPAIVMWGEAFNWATFGQMLHAARTGERAFDRAFGTGVFEYFQANPEANAIYNEGMTTLAAVGQRKAALAYDYRGLRTLVDVGGGHGSTLAAILAAHPELHGVLFDQPHVVAGAPAHLEAAGVAARCEVVAGSFFESIPAGRDGYLFTTVIHDWDDAHALRILENVRRAIPPRGRLLLVEVVLPPDSSFHVGRLIDLQVLVMHGARERTKEDFVALLESAGFRLRRVISTTTPMSVVEAVPDGTPAR
jgi:hypothetical protein